MTVDWLSSAEYSRQKSFFFQFADETIHYIVLGLHVLRFRPILLQDLGGKFYAFKGWVGLVEKVLP